MQELVLSGILSESSQHLSSQFSVHLEEGDEILVLVFFLLLLLLFFRIN